MASPQPDKHTRLSNELLEAIYRYPFTSNELRVFLFIVRLTYGYQRKVVNLRTKDFAIGTGINKSNIKRTLSSLLSSSCILCYQVDYKIGTTYGIQKDYDRWKPRIKKPKSVIKLITKSYQVDNSEQITPFIVKEKRKRKNFTPPDLEDVVNYFFSNGYTKESGKKAFEYYHEGDWKDSRGKQVLNWKQKMRGVWFKPENEIKECQPKQKTICAGDMSIYDN
jgi:phage replication O-like protein O